MNDLYLLDILTNSSFEIIPESLNSFASLSFLMASFLFLTLFNLENRFFEVILFRLESLNFSAMFARTKNKKGNENKKTKESKINKNGY